MNDYLTLSRMCAGGNKKMECCFNNHFCFFSYVPYSVNDPLKAIHFFCKLSGAFVCIQYYCDLTT